MLSCKGSINKHIIALIIAYGDKMSRIALKKHLMLKIFFITNLIKYIKKKVDVPFFEIWVGQTCSLRCVHCCHLIPYVHNESYDIDKTITDCKKILSLCNIQYFSIVGGEPFCNKDLYRLLDFISGCEEITDGKIVTNGTVAINSKTIESLKRLNGKLEVRIDPYLSYSEKAEEFYNLMKKNNIRCYINKMGNAEDFNWKMVGGPSMKKIDENIAQLLFSKCFAASCSTMANGELTACPRGITSGEVYGVKKNKYENIFLNKIGNGIIAKAKIATCLFFGMYRDYCKFCLSLSEINPYSVTPGEQLK